VLHAAYTGNEEVMQRFEREAQAAGRIGNDHILEVLDIGQLPDGDHFIIMEFLDGEPLSGRIKGKGRLMPREAAPIIRQVLEGLGAAHAAGIIHRDLKPDNIFILKEKAGVHDYVKIIDFGISKFNQLAGDGMKMTRTGAVMGTPYYMSPEQASGSAEADQRSDIYSMGVILYEAVTGQVPFDAGTFNQLMFKIVLSEVPAPESVVTDLDPAFSSIISKSMARDLTQRFQTTSEFIRALDAWMQHGTSVSLPPAGDAASAGLLPMGSSARAAMASHASLHRTGAAAAPATSGNWATSQPGQTQAAVIKKNNAGLIAALAAVGILVMGGAAFGAYSLLGKSQDSDAASSASAAASSVVAAPKAAPTDVASDAPKAVTNDPGVAPPAVTSAPEASAASGGAAAASASAGLTETGKPSPATATATAGPTGQLRPTRPTRPTREESGAAAGAPRPAPAAPVRKPSAPSTPDFGY
jgi:hypothetical protein